MKQWNEVFKKKGKVFLRPQEDMEEIARIFKKNGVNRILDLGCGTGRHLVFLTKRGFDVYGFDIAEDGIEIAKKWLKQEKLKANFKIGSIYHKLPYPDNFFDAVVSTQTLHHERIANIRKAIKEIERIIKPGGFMFATFFKRKFRKPYKLGTIVKKFGKQSSDYKIMGNRTYMPIEGHEKGLVHYVFNKEEMRKEFKRFKILNIWVESSRRHYCFLGKLIW